MKFNFARAVVLSKINESKDDKNCYFLRNFLWGPFIAPKEKIKIEVHPNIGEYTSYVLVDILGYGDHAKVIIAAETEKKIKEFFEQNKTLYPGVS